MDDVEAIRAKLAAAQARLAELKQQPVQVTFAHPTKPFDKAVLGTARAFGMGFMILLWVFIALIVVLVVTLAVASC